MNTFVYLFYRFLVALIHIYKRIEYHVLLLFLPLLKSHGLKVGESMGVVYHLPGDTEQDIKEREKRSLQRIKGKYKTLVHVKLATDTMFARWANQGGLAGGEGYMNKLLQIDDHEENVEFVKRVLENNMVKLYYHPWNRFLEWVELYAFNLQTIERSFQVGQEHYDLGNDLYTYMLDPWMQYTCAYWKDAKTLNEAQIAKLDLIARKLDLKPGFRVLDIGCGWGTLCKYLAENYQVECVGVTISEQGVAYGKEVCKGLKVDIRLQDYREVTGKFDRVVSIGCLEHVGHHNYRTFFKKARELLVDDGLFLMHSIGRNHYDGYQRSDPYFHKYIFKNGQLPSPIDIAEKTKDLWIIEDWHNFRNDYAKTLLCWRDNFIKHWPKLEMKYGEKFFRMWIAYLCVSRACFKSGKMQLWQIVLSKDGLQREYRAAR